MTDLWFLRQALVDLRAAHRWYEEQRRGLGDELVAAVDAAVESIAAFPAAYPVAYRDARRLLLERFPYCLCYRVHDEDALVIVACLHVALDPKRHQARLRG
ncbi:MAG: type II toxin-antitoxin system RelE/ParE family toxin [Actinobacteria bacterium]|nr:type II toxin-antitoxin system RelE/ParE family toxin [Actinomycetota bacterium]